MDENVSEPDQHTIVGAMGGACGAARPSRTRQEVVAGGLAAALVGAVVVVGVLIQESVALNHDVAWVLYSAQWMRQGAEFGRDIVAANPPLIWFLSILPLDLADILHVSAATGLRLSVWIVAFSSIGFVGWRLHRRSGAARPSGVRVFVLTLSCALLILCGRDFGQREHLALIAALPYLALLADRLDGRPPTRLPALAVGTLAGVGFALKPHFLAAFVLCEAVGLLRTRRLAQVLRPETIAVSGICFGYLLLVAVLTPVYLDEVVPAVLRVYWGFETDLWHLLTWPLTLVAMVALVAAFCVGWSVSRRDGFSLPLILAAAGLGFAIAYFAQGKGYSYHAYPMRMLALAAVAGGLTIRARTTGLAERARMGMIALLVICVSVEALFLGQWLRVATGPLAEFHASVDAAVDRYAGSGSFTTISTHPYPAFPTALHTRADYVGRSNSDLFLPAVVRLRRGDMGDRPGLLAFAEDRAYAQIRDVLARTPDVVLVDARKVRHAIGRSDFDYVAFLKERPDIRTLWRPYREVETIAGIRVFAREEGR